MSGQSKLEIDVVALPGCLLCGTVGKVLYKGLSDRAYNAPGTWTMVRCTNSKCGLIWLNPQPLASDTWKLYTDYYTHESIDNPPRSEARRFVSRFLGLATARERLYELHLAQSNGRLLDVGCGTGSRLVWFRERGWTVYGQEVDPVSAAIARSSDVDVYVGRLEDLKMAPVDVVTVNHVIEHVNDPVELLRSCSRLLRPGGLCVVATPNALSLGHLLFRDRWLALDPPRHLHLFNQQTLEQTAMMAGLVPVFKKTDSSNMHLVVAESIQRTGQRGTYVNVLARLAQVSVHWMSFLETNRGEELVMHFMRP